MYNIRVHYDNGDSITTRINADVSEIVNYYLDKPMYGVDLSARARCIEFLDGPVLPFRPQETILRRVYSLSDAYMKRHNLYNRFRFTADVYDRFSPVPIDREDAAYISGMFDRA